MQIETLGSVKRSTEGDFDTAKPVESTVVSSDSYSSVPTVERAEAGGSAGEALNRDEDSENQKNPTQNTIASVMSEANQRMSKTRCEYSYDEPTKRVSIKVYDKETDELIREVPPEKSLEMLQRMWELAGIIVDEKR